MAHSEFRDDNVSELWGKYVEGGRSDVKLRNNLVEHYLILAYSHAARISRRVPLELNEIVSAGFVGLINAVESYDPKREVSFETYCRHRLRGAILDWARSTASQSRTLRAFKRDRERAIESLDYESNKVLDSKDIAEKMGLSHERYNRLMRGSNIGRTAYLSDLLEGENKNSGGWMLYDVQDERTRDPSEKINKELFIEHINKGLSKEERMVLVLYYYESLTMGEIGIVLGLSESRISQIHKEVINNLKERYKGDGRTLREMVS
mgnify:FL=1